MNILILGGAGYIGSVLAEVVKCANDTPIIFDNYLYDRETWQKTPNDIRNIDALYPAIQKSDVVINLAAISNDPASDLQPHVTWEINYLANKILVDLLKKTGKRVIFASSCSMYGSSADIRDEESELKPLTLYARTKMLSEQLYLDKDLDSVILRLATVYGYSPQPRFDLVVNTMIGTGYFYKRIVVNGGDQVRPVIHVQDVANALYYMAMAHSNKYKVYNVGSNEQNYTIKSLGELIAGKIKGTELIVNEKDADVRNYHVCFDRIKESGFSALYSVSDAVEELIAKFEDGTIKSMEEDVYYRVKYLQNHHERL